ncbi:MAG: hypothetical protein ACM339_04135 [Ignavibacteria bacterium]
MKSAISILIVIILGVLIYFKYIKEEIIVEVNGNITAYQENLMNYDTPSVSGTFYKANIHGTAHNKGTEAVQDVLIKYIIGEDTVSAMVLSIEPGQTVAFRTGTITTKSLNPGYKFESVEYQKE